MKLFLIKIYWFETFLSPYKTWLFVSITSLLKTFHVHENLYKNEKFLLDLKNDLRKFLALPMLP